MPIIYAIQQGGYLRKTEDRLLFELQGELLADVPVGQVEGLVILGSIQISTQALLMLLENGIDVSFLSTKGQFRGSTISSQSKNVVLRVKAFEYSREPALTVEFAKNITKAKLRGALDVLDRYHDSQRSDFKFENRSEIPNLFSKIEQADNLDSVRGLEGYGSKLYFANFARLFKDVAFEGRKYFPSPDPVNACLSLGYSSIAREMQAALQAVGFDPFVGLFHQIEYGRASLSLDMIEEFRHLVIDRFVLKVFNKKIFDAEDFDVNQEGCFLKKPNFRRFYEQYEIFMTDPQFLVRDTKRSARELFQIQVDELRKAVSEKQAYHPFLGGVADATDFGGL